MKMFNIMVSILHFIKYESHSHSPNTAPNDGEKELKKMEKKGKVA